MPSSIHQEVLLPASPEEVYLAFMDEQRHSAFSGAKSKISQSVGGLAEMHDGQIVARNLELEPNKRIVQAWRVAAWEEGLYTLVRLTFAPHKDGAKVTLDQTGCPKEMTSHLENGWHARYWEPLKKYFGGK